MTIQSVATNSGSKGGVQTPRKKQLHSFASNSGSKGGVHAPRK